VVHIKHCILALPNQTAESESLWQEEVCASLPCLCQVVEKMGKEEMTRKERLVGDAQPTAVLCAC